MKYFVPVFAAALFTTISHADAATVENWRLVGVDKDAFGNDMRTVSIDPGSIRRTTGEVTVIEKITSNSVGNTGYNCGEGEIRHGNTPRKVVDMLCGRPSSANPYGNHTPDWQILSVNKIFTTKVDLNSIFRSGDEVMVSQMSSSTSTETIHYDCKGYYKIGIGEWRTLDLTDHISTVPSGYVSPERKAANMVCSMAKQ